MLAANVFETFGVGRNETIGANLFAPIIFITSRRTFEELTPLCTVCNFSQALLLADKAEHCSDLRALL